MENPGLRAGDTHTGTEAAMSDGVTNMMPTPATNTDSDVLALTPGAGEGVPPTFASKTALTPATAGKAPSSTLLRKHMLNCKKKPSLYPSSISASPIQMVEKTLLTKRPLVTMISRSLFTTS